VKREGEKGRELENYSDMKLIVRCIASKEPILKSPFQDYQCLVAAGLKYKKMSRLAAGS